MANIQKLSNEILNAILDNIESESQKCVSVDRREYLSVESFRLPSPPLPSQAQDVANFRLTCQRFAAIGIPYQFTRVTLRFSSRGFRRLDEICSNDHLVQHTRKFSYLVPLFYGDSELLEPPKAERADKLKVGYRLANSYVPQGRSTPLTLCTLQTYERGRKTKRRYYDLAKTSAS